MKFPTTYTIETERCCLRYVSKEDIPQIFSASRVKGFTAGMHWEPPEKEEELLKPYENNVNAWAEDRAYCFTIENKATKAFIGRVSIRKQEEECTWDLGFWTHPEQQGNGYMTEVVRGIIDFGFGELKALKVVACHTTWNQASERVLRNNGMSFIRFIPEAFKKNGKWMEENLQGITVEEWKTKPNKRLEASG